MAALWRLGAVHPRRLPRHLLPSLPALATRRLEHTFASLGLSPRVCDAAAAHGFVAPSGAQALAIPEVLAGRSVAIAASTGSGKTMAYLMPILHRITEEERAEPELRYESRPRALVLAPTRDLSKQIFDEAKQLSHVCRARVRLLTGEEKLATQRLKLREGVDVLVSTPARLLLLHKLGDLSLRKVRLVVIDEADDMLLRGFDEELEEVLARCSSGGRAATFGAPRAANASGASPPQSRASTLRLRRAGDSKVHSELALPQLAFVSASFPAAARHRIATHFPHTKMLFAPCVHRAPPSLSHRLVHIATGEDKLTRLVELLRSSPPSSSEPSIGGSLIFCRGVQSARAVAHALTDAGMRVESCHGALPAAMRAQALEAFSSCAAEGGCLVATDLAARGLDLKQPPHVINFDFPASSALYLHRAGRTARMGAPGTVTSLVLGRQRATAEALIAAVGRGEDLASVSLQVNLDRGKEQNRRQLQQHKPHGGGSALARAPRLALGLPGGGRKRDAPTMPKEARPSARRGAGRFSQFQRKERRHKAGRPGSGKRR